MDVNNLRNQRNVTKVCQRNKYGFCKFSQRCRNHHFSEICLETVCEPETCPKRHPTPCKFFQIYQRCKFGTDCAYKHCESKEREKIEEFQMKIKFLECENDEKTREITELNERLELVEKIIAEREEVFVAAVKAAVDNVNVTPVNRRKKRKKTKQHPTPSPIHHQHNHPIRNPENGHVQADIAEDEAEVETALTAEEIAQLYEDEDPGDEKILL